MMCFAVNLIRHGELAEIDTHTVTGSPGHACAQKNTWLDKDSTNTTVLTSACCDKQRGWIACVVLVSQGRYLLWMDNFFYSSLKSLSLYLFLLPPADLNNIKFSAYRTAMKLRRVQKALRRMFLILLEYCISGRLLKWYSVILQHQKFTVTRFLWCKD